MKVILLLCLAMGTTACSTSPAQPTSSLAAVRYRATFRATWSAATHPSDFPATAHFSPLVGGTHNGQVRLWTEGGIATDGIKDMAERGLTSTLSTEVSAASA
jgi:hypothetical protein